MSSTIILTARRWWPVAGFFALAILVQNLLLAHRDDVSGHAGEHLAGASVAFPAFAVVATLLYVTPRARRQPSVLVSSAMWVTCTVLVTIGNLRVVDALIDAGMPRTPTSEVVMTPSVARAHDLANLAPWLAVVASLAMITACWFGRHISGRVAVGAAILSVVFPPWIIPGAGVVVLVIARGIAFQRGDPPPRSRHATREDLALQA